MSKTLIAYLKWRCTRNWHPKYYKYIDMWIENVQPVQCEYFEKEMNHLIEKGVYKYENYTV